MEPERESLDEMLERVTFENPDPRIQRLKKIWEEARAEAETLLERATEDEFRRRKDRYEIELDDDPDGRALRETNLVRELFREERDQRLAGIWADVTRRVAEVLRELKDDGPDDE